MQVSKSEKPGVYSSYSTSKISGQSVGVKSVGIAAVNGLAATDRVYCLTSEEEASEIFGEGSMTNLVAMALENGALSAYCVAVGEMSVAVTVDDSLEESLEDLEEGLEGENEGSEETGSVVVYDYETAFALLEEEEGISMILCDSTEVAVQQALRDSVVAASAERKERIGVVAIAPSGAVADAVAQAKELNSERMVLVGGKCTSVEAAVLYAAAVAGVMATETDPALPLNGLTLTGVDSLTGNYSDNEMDVLLGSGVTTLEQSAGLVSIVRGVTSRTTTGGETDSTWREISTILVIDDVIPQLRSALKAKFQRSKNTDLTRGAIRSQVVVELERKKSSEIIVDYGDITVAASETDPTICEVAVSFAVAHGLNQIWISANVEV